MEMPGVGLWLPHHRIILPGDADFSLPPLGQRAAAPTYVDSGVVNNASGTGGTISKPASIANGDFMIMTLNTQVAVSSPACSGWSLQHSGSRMHVLYRVASSEGSSWSPTWTTSSNVVIGVIAFRGVDPASPFISSATTETNLGSDVYTTGALTFGAQDYMYVSCAAHASPNNLAHPSGFNLPISQMHTSNGIRGSIAYLGFTNTANGAALTWDYVQGGVTTVWSAALKAMPTGVKFGGSRGIIA